MSVHLLRYQGLVDTAEKATRTRKPSIIERDAQAFRRQTPKVGLVSLEKLAAVFSRSQNQQLPAGVEPGSIEAMIHCSYLRSRDVDPGADILDDAEQGGDAEVKGDVTGVFLTSSRRS